MRLGELLRVINVKSTEIDGDLEIRGLSYDSRQVKPGHLFVAIKGHTLDGHHFIRDAVARGATAILVQESGVGGFAVPTIGVENTRDALSRLAVTFYGEPFRGINLIGITGTNGKTTTSYLLESILVASGARPGVIGTVNYRLRERTWKAPVTTPESLDLMRTMRTMADGGATDVIMEVSSHALDQGRVRDCPFRVAVFTNITRDHLDYHGSMEAYFEAKSRLFSGLPAKGPGHSTTAVINGDDPKGEALAGMTDAEVVTFGLKRGCRIWAEQWEATNAGLSATLGTPWGRMETQSSLVGAFNIYNLLAASAVALSLNIGKEAITEGIAQLKSIPGRMERVENNAGLNVIVDYAHTPDALLKVLESLRPLTEGRLMTVFGCGGDRDKGKRREMGRVAARHSDVVFVTSDNPRTEEPAAIASQIESGVVEEGLAKLVNQNTPQRGYYLDLDRKSAIRNALGLAHKGDLVLIAGKGHEDYQIVGHKRHHFDDREVAREAAS